MTYHRPKSLKNALRLLALPELRVLAGGTDVLPATQGSRLVGDTLDLTAISALSGISQQGNAWRIGATTTWSEIANAPLPPAFRALQQAALEVGSVQIQNSATIAGNLCNASPAADGVPPLLVLDAEVELSSAGQVRHLPLSQFITGVREIALRPQELVTAIIVPNAAATGRSSFSKLGARKYLVISIAMVAAKLVLKNDEIVEAAVAVGACSPVATRLHELEQYLVGCSVKDPTKWKPTVEHAAREVLSPISDIRADTNYRMTAAVEIIQRTIMQAAL